MSAGDALVSVLRELADTFETPPVDAWAERVTEAVRAVVREEMRERDAKPARVSVCSACNDTHKVSVEAAAPPTRVVLSPGPVDSPNGRPLWKEVWFVSDPKMNRIAYVRSDLYEALTARAEKAERELYGLRAALQALGQS